MGSVQDSSISSADAQFSSASSKSFRMPTVIEIAGLVLATIPIVVKKVDDYAAGIRLIKAFGNKSYARQLRGYAAHLGGEEVILFRTFEMLLEGCHRPRSHLSGRQGGSVDAII